MPIARVEIVVLNYKGVDDTLSLLDNLSRIEYENFGVIIIENGSADNSATRLKEIQSNYSNWDFVYNKTNKGFAGGCNQGIQIAMEKKTDYVLLLNNDTIVDLKFLNYLVELSQKHNALTGGLIYFSEPQDRKIWSYGGNITWGAVPGHLSMFGSIASSSALPNVKKTDFIPGCCLLIPVEVIKKIGMIDEDYFAYVEDVDYCLRSSKDGFQSFVTSKSIIYHKVGQATGGGYSPRGRFLIAQSSVIFTRKHSTPLQRLKFIAFFWLGIIVASVRESLRGNFVAVREKINGYYSGWRKPLHEPKSIG